MNWKISDGSYFLEYDNKLLISKDTDGNYYLFNSKENKKYLVGIEEDDDITIKSAAEAIINQYNLLDKAMSVILFEQLLEAIKENCSITTPVYKKLVNAKFLPPSIISQYITRYIDLGQIFGSLNEDAKDKEGLNWKIMDLYNNLVSIDPKTQSVASATMDNNSRKLIFQEAKDFTAKGIKDNLVVGKGEKIYESLDKFSSNEEISVKGFSIENEELFTTVYVLFLEPNIYVVIVDELNNIDEMFKYNNEIQAHVLEMYGIDIAKSLDISSVNEGFMDNEDEDKKDNTNSQPEPPKSDEPLLPPQTAPKPTEIPKEEENNEFNFDDIISEHDEEYVQELEIIQRNINKIESLPEDIRYTEDIEEVYLLLLGKKEQIQKLSDEEKSSQIINKVVDEISTELGNIEGLTNINVKDDANDLDNSLTINEGKNIKFNGSLIKPIVMKKFGIFERRILIGKKSYKINENADIKKILETYTVDDKTPIPDVINTLISTGETVLIKKFMSYKLIELKKEGEKIVFKCWKYDFTQSNDDEIMKSSPIRNVSYNINNEEDMKHLKEDIDFFSAKQ